MSDKYGENTEQVERFFDILKKIRIRQPAKDSKSRVRLGVATWVPEGEAGKAWDKISTISGSKGMLHIRAIVYNRAREIIRNNKTSSYHLFDRCGQAAVAIAFRPYLSHKEFEAVYGVHAGGMHGIINLLDLDDPDFDIKPYSKIEDSNTQNFSGLSEAQLKRLIKKNVNLDRVIGMGSV